jgi:hypothetical protein
MSAPDPKQLRRSRVQLVLIFALFLIPPLSAWVAWQYLGEEGAQHTTNAGALITPARPLQVAGLIRADGTALDDAAMRGRWTYVLFAPSTCGERCEEQLYLTRQTRLSMNKDIPRVQRLLIFESMPPVALQEHLAADHEDLTWVVRETGASGLLEQFAGPGFVANGQQFFLVDPLGNLMMFYDLDVPAKGMMKDLQKLLKISQIG